MADVFDRQKRSDVMSRIRGRGNKDTELVLARLLRNAGLKGWRRHLSMVGRPDFVFRAKRVAVFVDGCFWHCCPKHSNMPATNREFWERKLTANKRRDRRVNAALKSSGWKVVRLWEHDIGIRPELCLRRIVRILDLSVGLESAPVTAPGENLRILR